MAKVTRGEGRDTSSSRARRTAAMIAAAITTICTAFSFNLLAFAIFRFFTGVGIGGEYAAINSAIDELIPSKVRGRVDLIVNGTFWMGASLGSVATLFLLGHHGPPLHLGWGLAFGIGGTLGLAVLVLRLAVPESPRWLMLRGREEEANKIVTNIESLVLAQKGSLPHFAGDKLKIAVRDHTPWKEIFANMLGENRQKSFLALALMVGQSFFFNAIFFTYGLIVKKFFHIPDQSLPLQLLPFSLGSFFGPLMLGPLFDKIGRKPMIIATYGVAGLGLAAICYPFAHGLLTAKSLNICFTLIFVVASSAASSAYLTVRKSFPLRYEHWHRHFLRFRNTRGGRWCASSVWHPHRDRF